MIFKFIKLLMTHEHKDKLISHDIYIHQTDIAGFDIR